MIVHSVPANQISAEEVAKWKAIQQADGALDNPLLCPEFTQAVAQVRDDVEVGVMRQADRCVGFFPFQRGTDNVGRPVASIMSDMQGVVVETDSEWNAMQLINGCNLAAWHFDHLLATQKPFVPFFRCVEDSPYMDLGEGYGSYLANRQSNGGSWIKQAARKSRKLAKDFGAIEFEWHSDAAAALDQLIEWKQAQLQQMHYIDVFRFEWLRNLMNVIQQTQGPDFDGVLSTLKAGGRLVAVHLGMQSHHVLSSWIPAYDPNYSKYSPGLLLHLEMAKRAAEIGITRIDLCRGQNRMKTELMSGSFPVALGFVDTRPLHRWMHGSWYFARDAAYATSFGQMPIQIYRRIRNFVKS